ncbi:MAG: DUF1361 domain-containing protein, partial [Anaerolineae bacterium]|nr:DUF1361 domain-containing protein [Anaerolineae bacterium]
MINWILNLHYFSKRQAVYAISLSTLLAGLLMAGRIYMSGSLTHIYLVWNLFLAWIPYLAGLWVAYTQQKYPRQWWLWPLPGLIWLAFFPNAPYLVTDFIHLRWYPPVPLWYDVGLLTVFAWTGLFLAVFSLRAMQLLVKRLAGTVISWLFVLGMLGLSGLGVWLGRFLR